MRGLLKCLAWGGPWFLLGALVCALGHWLFGVYSSCPTCPKPECTPITIKTCPAPVIQLEKVDALSIVAPSPGPTLRLFKDEGTLSKIDSDGLISALVTKADIEKFKGAQSGLLARLNVAEADIRGCRGRLSSLERRQVSINLSLNGAMEQLEKFKTRFAEDESCAGWRTTEAEACSD